MLIVEDGTIVAGANAYIDTAYLDSYWADRNVTLSQTTAEKEAAIILATQYVDGNNTFKGEVVDKTQPLEFPRKELYNARDYLIPSDEIPAELKMAVAEYAKRQLDSDIQPDVSEKGAISSERKKLASLETETTYQEGTGGYYGIKRYPMADNYLKGLIKSGAGSYDFGMVRC